MRKEAQRPNPPPKIDFYPLSLVVEQYDSMNPGPTLTLAFIPLSELKNPPFINSLVMAFITDFNRVRYHSAKKCHYQHIYDAYIWTHPRDKAMMQNPIIASFLYPEVPPHGRIFSNSETPRALSACHFQPLPPFLGMLRRQGGGTTYIASHVRKM